MTNKRRLYYWQRIKAHLDKVQDIFEQAQNEASDSPDGADEFADFDFLGTTLGSAQDDVGFVVGELEAKLDEAA